MLRYALRRAAISKGLTFRPAAPLFPSQTWTNQQRSHTLDAPWIQDVLFATRRGISRQFSSNLIAANDTVYALSSAPGRGAIALIRISGVSCLDVRSLQSCQHENRANTLCRYIVDYVLRSLYPNLGTLWCGRLWSQARPATSM